MDGILIINKSKGVTSHDIAQKLKKITNEKIGHTGTLDPLATGVLPLLIGKATKISKYLIEHDKIYEGTIKLGEKTDTGDSEGKVILQKEVDLKNVEENDIREILKFFLGKQKQTPPIYSAIKVNGKKLYQYARENKEVEIPKREIEIYKIELLNYNKTQKEIVFKVHCSKGTYIRTLCEDISEKLGTVGYMSQLNRIQVGCFNIENSITIEQILENENKEIFLKNNIITIEQFFKDMPIIFLNEKELELFLNGVKLTENKPDGIYQITENGKWIGLGIIENRKLKRDVVL